MLTLFAGCKKEEPKETTESTLGLNINLAETTAPDDETVPAETEATEPKENMGTVTQQMNVRGTPSMQSGVMGTLYQGDRVQIIQQEEVVNRIWGRIKEPYAGWVAMDYIQMDDPEDAGNVGSNDTPASSGNVTPPADNDAPSGSTVKGVIAVNGLNIRSEPSTSGKIEGSYNKGDVVTILEQKDGWGRTNKGWIDLDHVQITSGNGGNSGGTTAPSGNGSTTVLLKGVVRAGELNIRASASTGSDRVGGYVYGDRVEILEKDGSWGRTSKGWIHLDYVYQDGTTGVKTGNGTVTATGGLNIRSGPGTNYDSVGASYANGERVKILEQFTYGTTTWGCTSKGWISLSYVDMDGGNNTNTGTNAGTTSNVGVVTTGIHIREGAGTDYQSIGSYDAGEVVTILERSNGWGRTDRGWISLNYVNFNANVSTGNNGTGKTGTTTTGLNVRAGAGTQYDRVGGIDAGTRVTILEISNGWGRIDGGWISMNFVDLD